ncbi:hypothetical protein ACIA8E_36730 [Streptomyces sp. NPDC051664]
MAKAEWQSLSVQGHRTLLLSLSAAPASAWAEALIDWYRNRRRRG